MTPLDTFIVTFSVIILARLLWCWGWWAACRQIGIHAADEDWVAVRRDCDGTWRATLLHRGRGVGHE